MRMTTKKFYDMFNLFIKITEIYLGSIENGSAVSDLPQRVWEKVDLSDFEYFRKKVIKSSPD